MSGVPKKWWRDELTGDLELEVSTVPSAWHFDNDEHGIEPWKKVDFVFHWPAEKLLWLVEVKDPDNPYADSDTNRLILKFQSNELHGNLAHKGKETFLYLLLEDRLPPDTTILYIVLFACERLKPGHQARYHLNATKALRRVLGIDGPNRRGWARQRLFIRDCLILSLEQWNAHVGMRVQVRRFSTNHE